MIMTDKKRPDYISILQFQGASGGGGGGSISGTIAATQVAYGTGTDTIGGENDFVYDATNNVLTVEKVDGQIILKIRNETGSTIPAGAVVYVSANSSSGRPLVALANASDSAKMPSACVVANQLATGNNGYGILTGQLNGLDGSFGNTVFDSTITALDVGKTVYVSPTNAGRLTKTKPTTSTDLIQNVGRIINVDGNNVKIAVNNIGRSNDVPNSFSTTGNIDAGSLTVNSDYTFPTTDGSSGQVLVTDGVGNLTFQNQSSTTISISKVADETIAIGDLIRVVQNGESGFTAGRVVKAIDSESKSEELYVATSGATQGNSLTMSMIGELGITFVSIPNTTDNGKKAYLSSTSGQATLNAPTSSGTIVVLLGILTGANGVDSTVNVLFRPQFIISN